MQDEFSRPQDEGLATAASPAREEEYTELNNDDESGFFAGHEIH